MLLATTTAVRRCGTKTTQRDPEGGNYSRDWGHLRRKQSDGCPLPLRGAGRYKFKSSVNFAHPAKRDRPLQIQNRELRDCSGEVVSREDLLATI